MAQLKKTYNDVRYWIEDYVEADTNYVRSHNKYAIYATSGISLNKIGLDLYKGAGVLFEPNTKLQFGGGIVLSGMKRFNILNLFDLNFMNGTSIELTFPIATNSADTHGETTGMDFQMNGCILQGTFIYNLSYVNLKGFYLRDPNAFNTAPKVLGSDIGLMIWGGDLTYVLNNKKMSHSSVFNLSNKQIKSTGSVLFNIGYRQTKIEADSTLKYQINTHETPSTMSVKSSDCRSPFIGIGYGYTSTIKRDFYFHISTIIRLHYQQGTYIYTLDKQEEQRDDRPFVGGLNYKIGMGYNTSEWFAGLSVVSDISYNKIDVMRLDYEVGKLRLSIGKRF